MIVVVDTNIIFSSLLSHKTFMAEVLLNKNIQFISPNFLFIEIFKHKEKILKYSKLSEDELLELFNLLLSNIQFISSSALSSSAIQKAIDFCKNIDMKDVPFISLCVEYEALLWSGDNKLKISLSQNNFNNFFNP